jgi:hypothetical protein
MAANDAYSQQALAADPRFRLRLQNALANVAWQVLEEDPSTLHHAERATYATTVSANLFGAAASLAPSFVTRPNVMNFPTSYDFTVGATVTAAGDPDLESQLHTDWNMLAGVVTP